MFSSRRLLFYIGASTIHPPLAFTAASLTPTKNRFVYVYVGFNFMPFLNSPQRDFGGLYHDFKLILLFSAKLAIADILIWFWFPLQWMAVNCEDEEERGAEKKSLSANKSRPLVELQQRAVFIGFWLSSPFSLHANLCVPLHIHYIYLHLIKL